MKSQKDVVILLLLKKQNCRSVFHDQLRGTDSLWPPFYDGRAIVTDSYRDHRVGVSLEENKKRFNQAKESGDNSSRGVVWS